MFSPPVKRSPQFGKRRWFQDILRQIPAPQRAAAGGWEPLRHANAEPELRMLHQCVLTVAAAGCLSGTIGLCSTGSLHGAAERMYPVHLHGV